MITDEECLGEASAMDTEEAEADADAVVAGIEDSSQNLCSSPGHDEYRISSGTSLFDDQNPCSMKDNNDTHDKSSSGVIISITAEWSEQQCQTMIRMINRAK